MGHFAGTDRVLYPAGLLIAALAAGGVVLAAASPGLVSWALGGSALRWIGIRSYGIYLWHWPVIALAGAAFPQQLPAHWIWLPEAALSVGLAAASWRWVEEPIIRQGFRATVRARYRMIIGGPAGRAPRTGPGRPRIRGGGGPGRGGCGGVRGAARPLPGGAGRADQRGGQGQPAGPGRTRRAQPGGRVRTQRPGPVRQLAGRHCSGRQRPICQRSVSGPSATPAGATRATAAPAPGSARVPAPARVPGSQVFALGDSVMLASAVQLAAALPGISIDAQVSRQAWAGLSIVRRLAATGRLRPVVVFALGTNGTFTSGQMRQLVRVVGPHRDLVLVNTYEARPWEAGVNRVIAAAARRYPNVVMANWFATIEHRTSLLWPDEVHPQPSGARLYARMVAAAVRTARAASTASGTSAAGLPPAAHHVAPLS